MSLTLLALTSLAAPGPILGPQDFPELESAQIAGAPRLGTPFLVEGETAPLMGGQHGLAAPARHDWDGDGLEDLLIGEFETGPCWVRVYRNVGKARVFRSERDAIRAIKSRDEDEKVKAGDIMVLTCGGPMGTGMEEVYQITAALKHLSYGKHVALITDARVDFVDAGCNQLEDLSRVL